MFTAAGMLFATSCSNDELDMVQSGDEAQVTFSLGTEGGIATRAISDGKSADVLYYAIYDADQKLITTIANSENGLLKKANAFPESSKQDNVTVTLAKGQKYTAVFWAQDASCGAYTVTAEEDGLKVAVNYEGANNDETRDAFFKAETFTVTGNANIDVELKRPFAQINVGVTEADWNAAVASGIEIEKSKVTISKVATSLNLLTGEVDGEETVEYGLATIPHINSETLEVDVDRDGTIEDNEKFKYLSMSYILANDETTGYAKTTLEDLDFTFVPGSGNNNTINDIKFDEGLTAVPVQRNWRTNIIGQILTGNITFNIEIDPIYDGEYNNGKAYPVNISGTYYATIQDAVNAAQEGDVIKVATGSYTEVVKVTGGKNLTLEAAGPDVVIAGLDHQNNSNLSTIKVKGFTFDNSLAESGWFTGTAQNIYPCVGAWGGNLSFEECKFIVDGNSGKETGVMTWWVTNKTTLSFDKCTFEGKDNHASARAMQIYGDVDLTVTNCTFTTAKDYSLKYVGKSGSKAQLSNNIVNNSQWFVEIGSSVYPGEDYKVVLNNNTLGKNITAYAEGYNNAITTETVTVEASQNVNAIADGLIKNEKGEYVASTDDGIASAIKENATEILLEEGTYIIPDDAQGKTLSFIGTGNPEDTKIATQHDGSYEGCDYSLDGATATFENISINTKSTTYTGYARLNATYKNCIINGTYTLYGKSTFEDCTFNVSGDVYNIWTWGANEAKFTNCKFNCDGKALLVYNQTLNLTIDNCIFNDLGNISGKSAIETGVDAVGAASYDIKITDTKFNGFDVNDEQEGYKNIVGNKNNISKDYLNVTIDGVDVY